MTENNPLNNDLEPCPDEDTLREYASQDIDDEFTRSIIKARLQFCPECNRKLREIRSAGSTENSLKSFADRFRELSAQVQQAEKEGPRKGTLWRAKSESEDDNYGPLLFVIETDLGEDGESAKVVEISEEISQALDTDLIVEPEESGLNFRLMVRAGNCFLTSKNNLQTYVGGLTEVLTLKIIKFCQRTQNFDVDIPLSEYQFFKDVEGNELMFSRGLLTGLFPNGDDDPRLSYEEQSKEKYKHLKEAIDLDAGQGETTKSEKVIELRPKKRSFTGVFLQVAAVIVAMIATWEVSEIIHKQSMAQLKSDYKRLSRSIMYNKPVGGLNKKVLKLIEDLRTKYQEVRATNAQLEKINAEAAQKNVKIRDELAEAKSVQSELKSRLSELDPSFEYTIRMANRLAPLIFAAVEDGALQALREAVKDGNDVNERKYSTGITPLHIAAKEGNLEAAKILIDNGARVNAVDFEGQTPLIKAAKNGHSQIVMPLILQGADPKMKDKNGKTAEDWAKFFNHKDVVRIFEKGSSK